MRSAILSLVGITICNKKLTIISVRIMARTERNYLIYIEYSEFLYAFEQASQRGKTTNAGEKLPDHGSKS